MSVPIHDKLGGCDRKDIQHKNWGDNGGGSLISPDGVAPSRIVGKKGHKTVVYVCVIRISFDKS